MKSWAILGTVIKKLVISLSSDCDTPMTTCFSVSMLKPRLSVRELGSVTKKISKRQDVNFWEYFSIRNYNCVQALGMESYAIPNSALSASSVLDPEVQPANARIRLEQSGGAWCPLNDVSQKSYEYLQIDLDEMKVITMVETQGRFGQGQGQEYAEQYRLEYQREEGGKWFSYHNRHGEGMIAGNTNTYATEIRDLDPPIIARNIRFVPYSQFSKKVCLRVEIYGCKWTDHLISYDMPLGQTRGNEFEFSDFIYDGVVKDGYRTGGLGQLTDGMLGDHNFRLDLTGSGRKGYEWIGWRNDTQDENKHTTKPITIVFKFDSVRNFTSVRFHSNNYFEKDIRVFRMAKISFSIGGTFYTEPPLVYRFMRDDLFGLERFVVIPLKNNIGRYMKAELYFDAKWILLSEIHFESVAATPPSVRESHPKGAVDKEPIPKGRKDKGKTGKETAVDAFTVETGPYTPTITPNPTYIAEEKEEKETYIVNYKRKRGMNEEIIGIIVGALAVLIIIFLVIFIVICLRNKRQKYNNNHRPMKPNSYHASDVIISMTNGKPGHGYNIVTSLDMDSDKDSPACYNLTNSDLINGELQSRKLPDLPKTPDSTLSGTLPQHYASSTLLSIQGVTGNNVYAAPQNLDLMWRDDIHVMEFPRENLKPIEKLGEGQFGEVQLCEATGLSEILGDDFLVNRVGSKSMLVAVKMLRANADHQAKLDFNKELKVMCQLRDPNIVQVLGMCSTSAPLAVIVEYMKYGDLYQYLQRHDLDGGASLRRNSMVVSYGCLIYMATQIASGMKYLESLNIVHRDLATRNCLVGAQYTIKISDFGMSRSLYSNDYYRIEGKAVLPIRWMAWESVLLGKFSSKSDVWSFGVTMWEILTFAREQPFEKLSDDDVIENCTHYFQNDGMEEYLSQPLYCPKEIYDLLRECWNCEDHTRPSFREIHMFLQRKNMGYNPRDENMTSAFATLPASFI